LDADTEKVFDKLESTHQSKHGHVIPKEECALIEGAGSSPQYGELERTGRLLRLLNLGPDDHFVDLGSGRGRLAMHAALKTQVGSAVGVEMSATRHALAEQAQAGLQGLGYDFQGKLQLECKDFLRGPFIEEATCVYMCNTVFPDRVCTAVAERCLFAKGFRVLLTTRELYDQPWLQKVGKFTENYSWSDSARDYIHVYARNQEDVPAPLLAKLFCMEMRGDADAYGALDLTCSCPSWNSAILPEDDAAEDGDDSDERGDDDQELGEQGLVGKLDARELAFGEYGDVSGEGGIAWP